MEKNSKLSNAAMEGSVAKLNDLIKQDPLLLHMSLASCVSETPLHIASMLGHVAFVRELLSRNPEFSTELDASGSTPLHLVAGRGHVEVVRELLRAGDHMACVARNQDGMTALHVAAVKGRVEVVRELIKVKGSGELTRALTDRGESAMHLCVGKSRLEILRVLVESVGRDDEVLNWKDGNGNTVLHLAVAKKQLVMIKYLVTSTGVDVNALNANGCTELDILLQSPRDLKDMEIEDCLREAGAQRAKDTRLIEPDWVPRREPSHGARRVISSSVSMIGERTMTRRVTSSVGSLSVGRLGSRALSEEGDSNNVVVKPELTEWLGRKRDSLMVVASLLATVAFQAAITPPGGVWQDDSNVDANGNTVEKPHTIGTSTMATNNKGEYGVFMIFNTIAFLSSLSIILLLVSGLPIKKRRWMWIQMIIMWVAITTQVATYFLSLRHMSPKNVEHVLREVSTISVLTWLCLVLVVFIGNVIRLNLWVLKKYGYINPKEGEQFATIDEEEEV